MFRRLTSLVIVTLLFTGTMLRADEGAASAQGRGFKPIWTAVGASAGFGLGVWAGLTKFDDAIDSDRKVWTTAIVSAAIGGVLGYLVDRRQARANPPAGTRQLTIAQPSSWQQAIYGSTTASPSLRLPTVAELTGLDAPRGR